MSILSEAWRRARGRHSRWARTLGAVPEAPSARVRPPVLPWLLCALLAALVAGLGVYAWLIHDQARPSPAMRQAPAARASLPAGGESDTGDVAGLLQTRSVRESGRKVHAAPAQTAAPVPAVDEHTERGGKSPPEQGSRTGSAGDQGDGAHADARGTARQAPRPDAPVALSMLPVDVRGDFPDFTIVAHVWNTDPARRFVITNGRRVEVGGRIAAGVRLLEITRNGEIVGFRGYRIKLP